MAKFTLKRWSGKMENGREKFELGASRGDGVRLGMLDCDAREGFETRSSGSVSGRPAAEEIVAALDMNNRINLIVV